MTKYEWEKELKKYIQSLPNTEVARVLDYYAELFEDMAESGRSEKEIIAEFGNPFDVAHRILNEYEDNMTASSTKKASHANSDEEADYQQKNIFLKIGDKISGVMSKVGDIASGAFEGAKKKLSKNNSDDENAGFSQPQDIQYHPSSTGGEYSAPIVTQAADNSTKSENSGTVKSTLILIIRILLFFPFIGIFFGAWGLVLGLGAGSIASVLGGIAMALFGVLEIGANFPSALVDMGMGIAAVGAGILMMMITVLCFKVTVAITKIYFGKGGKYESQN